jgi:transposase
MPSAKCCHRRDCSRPVVTAFREEALCLDHFCHRSYEFLDALGQRSPSGSLASLTAEQVRTVDECARRALDICMNTNVLNNLDRARLLDILLWCGDAAASLPPNGGEAILVSARSSD